MTILFNLELLCYIPLNKVNSLFKKIRKKFDINDNTNKLFNYFNKYWLGKRYPIKLWNYYDRPQIIHYLNILQLIILMEI